MSTTEARPTGGPSRLAGNGADPRRRAVRMRNLIEWRCAKTRRPDPARPARRALRDLHGARRGGRVRLVALPAPDRNWGEIAARRRARRRPDRALARAGSAFPRTTQLLVPLGFLVLAALLQDERRRRRVRASAVSSTCAILWLALSGRRAGSCDRAGRARCSSRSSRCSRSGRPSTRVGVLAADRHQARRRDDLRLHDPEAARGDAGARARGDPLVAAARVAERGRERARDRDRAPAAARPRRGAAARARRGARRRRPAPGRNDAAALRRGLGRRRRRASSASACRAAGTMSGHVLAPGSSERADVEPDDPAGRPRPRRAPRGADEPLGAARRPRPGDRRDRRARQGRSAPACASPTTTCAWRRPSPRAPRSRSTSRERVARDAVRRVVAAQEVERRRLARELHDETGQTLTSITLGLKSVEERVDDPATREAIAALGRQVAATMQDVRRIALELRPKVLDDYGLVSALERLTTTFSSQTGIPVDLEAQLGPSACRPRSRPRSTGSSRRA